MKLKLKSSNRMNRRYLVLRANDKETVEKTILDYLGILGWSKSDPIFVKVDKNEIILSVNRKEVENVKAAFELTKENISIVKISGTLNGLGRNI